jgi:hypothetical protein
MMRGVSRAWTGGARNHRRQPHTRGTAAEPTDCGGSLLTARSG